MHILETLPLCGSYKIMQDILCIFQEISCISMHDLEILLVWILQDNARSLVHFSKKYLVFQCMIMKLYCSVDLTR